jgi:hypothetical protein
MCDPGRLAQIQSTSGSGRKHQMDDPQLRDSEVIGQLTGRAENMAAGGVGLDLRLKWSHNELKRYAPTRKVSLGGVLVSAVAVVASVWHHW